MKREKFIKYAKLTEELKELLKKHEIAKAACLQDMEVNKVDRVKIENIGTFSIFRPKTWKYSIIIQKAEKQLLEAKKIEQKNGTAKAKITRSLRFQSTDGKKELK